MRQDLRHLRSIWRVWSCFFRVKSRLLVPVYMLRLFFTLLFKSRSDYLITFGGYHSYVATLVAKLKGVNAFIILNGADSASIPDFNYGYLRKRWLKYCCQRSYRWATRLLPVSDSLMATTNHYAFDAMPLGLRAVFPKEKWDYTVIPNGFDFDFLIIIN